MKFRTFLNELNHHVIYGYEINLREIQYILRLFSNSLSTNEYNQYKQSIDLILNFTNKQITLESFIQKQKELELELELKELKEVKD